MVTSLAALAAARVSTLGSPLITRKKLEKSTPPSARPIGGISTSLTSELMMAVKDAPMMTPTARSTTLPRTANFLNSASTDMDALPLGLAVRLIAGRAFNKPPRHRQIGRRSRQSQQGTQ